MQVYQTSPLRASSPAPMPAAGSLKPSAKTVAASALPSPSRSTIRRTRSCSTLKVANSLPRNFRYIATRSATVRQARSSSSQFMCPRVSVTPALVPERLGDVERAPSRRCRTRPDWPAAARRRRARPSAPRARGTCGWPSRPRRRRRRSWGLVRSAASGRDVIAIGAGQHGDQMHMGEQAEPSPRRQAMPEVAAADRDTDGPDRCRPAESSATADCHAMPS